LQIKHIILVYWNR